ncbi:hypothetical protein BDF14DRAFT_1762519 [Spinellus fusiger]|nr:hypothetical protein BDF14DRAFT_1762519 [Spinellus fusiger]
MSTMLISCSISITLTVTSVYTVWAVYKTHLSALTIGWWIYFILTIIAYFNYTMHVIVLIMMKEDFRSTCLTRILDKTSPSSCQQYWGISFLSISIIAFLGLTINIVFAYTFYYYCF